MLEKLLLLGISLPLSFYLIITFNALGKVGFLVLKKSISQHVNSGFFERVVFGSMIYTIFIFTLGILNISYAPIVFYSSLSIPIVIYSIDFKHTLEITKKISNRIFKPSTYLRLLTDVRFYSIIAFYLFGLFLTFRPITHFDANWYHLPIPKFFLQYGNIDYLGEHTRYSVHPYMNFFWNMFFLSTPRLSVATQSIAINFFALNFVSIAIFKLISYIKSSSFIPNWMILFLPIPVFFNTISIYFLGGGYNDSLTVPFVILICITLFDIHKKRVFTTPQLLLIFIGLFGLFQLKIFFGILAFFIGLFVLYQYFTINQLSIKSVRSFFVPLFAFICVFTLPWVIRSYLQTGRLLDPIGLPGLNQDAYNFAGSGSSETHWSTYIYDNFFDRFIPFYSFYFSPLMFFGLLSIGSKKMREIFGELTVYIHIIFWLLFFISIVSDMRYAIPEVFVISLFGYVYIGSLWKFEHLKFVSIILVLLVSIFPFFKTYRDYKAQNEEGSSHNFLVKNQSVHEYLDFRLGQNIFNYIHDENEVNIPTGSTVFVWGLHSTGQLNFNVVDPRNTSLFNISNPTLSDYITLMEGEDVEYVLVKNIELSSICSDSDSDLCDLSRFRHITTLEDQEVTWYQFID